MKYLLILLFIFSTQVFSGEIDGKGINCTVKKATSVRSKEKMIFWFNNSRVAEVYVRQNYDFEKKIDLPGFKKIPKRKRLNKKSASSYKSNSETIYWDLNIGIFTLNRKSLELNYKLLPIQPGDKNLIEGSCKVFEGFKEVKKIQNEMIERKKEYNRLLEEIKKEAREGNKI